MIAAQEVLRQVEYLDDATLDEAQQHYIDNARNVETASDSQYSGAVLEALAENFVSPVQSIETPDTTYYGVIDYEEGDEWYGFEAHDDRSHGRRVIGVREIPDVDKISNIPHVTAGDPTGSFADQPDASYHELAASLGEFYDDKYGEDRGPPAHAGPPSGVVGKRGPPKQVQK